MKACPPTVERPYLFAWYSLVSKFKDSVTCTWKATGAAKGGKGKAGPKKEAPAAQAAPAQVKASPAGGPARNPACSDADWNALEALKAKIVVMKKEKAAKADIDTAVVELKRLKAICELSAGSAQVKAKAAPKKQEAKPKEDEMDDLFGDDDDEAAAEAKDHAAMLRGKAFEAKKKAAAEAAGKAPLEAKSLIIYEVKPVDDETDL